MSGRQGCLIRERQTPSHRRRYGIVLAVSVWLLMVSGATAQSIPERTDPPMDQAVPVMPSTIELWFSEALQPDGATVQVLNSEGVRVDLDDVKIDSKDPAHPLVTIGVHPGLDNGVYNVQWTSVSAVDGTAANGNYRLVIDPAASPRAVPQIATRQAIAPVSNSGGDDATEADGQNPLRTGIGIGVAVLAVVGLVLFWFFRRPARGRRWRDDVVDRL